eukprot:3314746-Rhodomonas_salina.1
MRGFGGDMLRWTCHLLPRLVSTVSEAVNAPLDVETLTQAMLFVSAAAHEMFAIAFNHADGLRDGWACLLDYVARLHRLKALPASLMEGDDFADLHGRPLHSASDPEALHRRTPTVPSSGGVGSFFRSISYLWGAAQVSLMSAWTALVCPGGEFAVSCGESLGLDDDGGCVCWTRDSRWSVAVSQGQCCRHVVIILQQHCAQR